MISDLIFNLTQLWHRLLSRQAEAKAERHRLREQLSKGQHVNVGEIMVEVGWLTAEQQRELFELLRAKMMLPAGAAAQAGKARRHFGAWDSGDARSADNDRIDRDLAREYGNAR